jgi:hypothetical protein
MNYIVNVTHLNDDDLSFFGWEKIRENDEFVLYWSHRYNEPQVVSKNSPRFLVVDDVNDASAMARGCLGTRPLIKGPSKAH